MITAWDIDPDAVKTPAAASIGQRLAGTSDGSDPLGQSGGVDQSLIKVCTYGAPPLGPHLLSESSDLVRTFTMPDCDGGTSDFQSALGAQSLFGASLFGFASLRGSAVAPNAPVHLAGYAPPSQNRSAVRAPANFSGPIGLHLSESETRASEAHSAVRARSGGASSSQSPSNTAHVVSTRP